MIVARIVSWIVSRVTYASNTKSRPLSQNRDVQIATVGRGGIARYSNTTSNMAPSSKITDNFITAAVGADSFIIAVEMIVISL